MRLVKIQYKIPMRTLEPLIANELERLKASAKDLGIDKTEEELRQIVESKLQSKRHITPHDIPCHAVDNYENGMPVPLDSHANWRNIFKNWDDEPDYSLRN